MSDEYRHWRDIQSIAAFGVVTMLGLVVLWALRSASDATDGAWRAVFVVATLAWWLALASFCILTMWRLVRVEWRNRRRSEGRPDG